MKRVSLLTIAILIGLQPLSARAASPPDPLQPLVKALDQLAAPLTQQTAEPVTIRWQLRQQHAEAEPVEALLELTRVKDDQFALCVTHPRASAVLLQHDDACTLWLPEKKLAFVADGPAHELASRFTLSTLAQRLRKISPELALAQQMLQAGGAKLLLPMLTALGVEISPAPSTADNNELQFAIGREGKVWLRAIVARDEQRLLRLVATLDGQTFTLSPTITWQAELPSPPSAEDISLVQVSRAELEETLLRGVCRAAEIQYETVRPPRLADRLEWGPHGYYWVREGQRIVGLRGTSREIGLQHGRFLRDEIRKTIESTLYVVGLLYSIERGRWFLDEIRAAQAQLDLHTPPEYLDELRGLAEGAGLPYEQVHLASYFPELFHCSGFALHGAATVDGKLYHGRVLDYMTQIGLQNVAAVFVVEKEGKVPFCNVGFAGFTGCVTGMNAERISVGEMGGRGEGQWNGVPMAVLMRMALEEARSLEEVQTVFREQPRTCEYYYIFADGEQRKAVGVYATPEKIEFIQAGTTHPRLPRPFADSLLLSAGERYNCLCDRVEAVHGKLTQASALELMNYPVAMGDSNLHNVLMSPEDQKFWVANAGPAQPAYREAFFAYDLGELRAKFNTRPVAPTSDVK